MADPNARPIRFLRHGRITKDVQKHLNSIDQVPGVQGWMVGTNNGDVLFTSMLAAFNEQMLDDIGHGIFRAATNVMGGDPMTELEINFTEGNLLAQKIGNGWLIVFCDPRVDLALSRMTLGVTAAALNGDRSLQSDLSSLSRAA